MESFPKQRRRPSAVAAAAADACAPPRPAGRVSAAAAGADAPNPLPPELGPVATLGDVLAAAERAGGPNKGVWKRGHDAAGRARRAFVVAFLGPDRPVTAIGRADLHRLVAHLEARPGKKAGTALSPKTVNRYLAAVSGILRFACLEGALAGRPPVPLQSEDEGRIIWLTAAEEQRLCDHLASRGWGAESLTVAVLCASGLRWGEFARIEAHEVLDWGTRTFKIAVERSKNRQARTVSIAPGLGRALRTMLINGERPTYYAMRTRLAAAGRLRPQSGDHHPYLPPQHRDEAGAARQQPAADHGLHGPPGARDHDEVHPHVGRHARGGGAGVVNGGVAGDGRRLTVSALVMACHRRLDEALYGAIGDIPV